MTPSPTESRSYTCPWCNTPTDPSAQSCSACGSPIDVRRAITHSGWSELPPIKDMARIQFGSSTCQVEGAYVPVADFNLAADDGVYFTHHLLLWKDEQVNITAMSLKGGWKRLFAGLPLVMTQATGPGRIAFSKDKAGELLALPLQPGQTIDVREHVFMIATSHVLYDWFSPDIWFTTQSGKDTETHYPIGPFMDRFMAGADHPGLLLLHGGGNVFIRTFEPHQSILIKPTSLLFKDTTVGMHLHFEHPSGTWRSWRSWGNRYTWLRMTGPGRVAVQSNYEHFEDPGYDLRSTPSATTARQW
jgi:uncharacterized protein (AIM24 family)